MPDISISSVRKSLRDLCIPSASHRTFLPEGVLSTVLKKEVIRSLLSKDLNFDPKELDQEVKKVFTKALKVFATLILMESHEKLKNFLDQRLYDNKLPFDEQDLAFLGQDLEGQDSEAPGNTRIGFLREQHIFLAPVFYKDAIPGPMDSKYILPFLHDEVIAQGAFGVVYKIQIHPKHRCPQTLRNGEYKAGWFARKQFKPISGHKTGFEREKKILELLLKLEHPNILPLLATYTHDNNFNMIFPLADMTLYDYLHTTRNDYPSMMSLFQKVHDLIKALNHIHNFAYTEGGKQLELKGYHHDLKPKNILVQGEKFVIADFGLANLKDVGEPSDTNMWVCIGAYPFVCRNRIRGRYQPQF